jgi:sugar phosphate isomerase/epimerase
MRLLFGTRPFEFSDFFALFQNGQFDFSKLNFIEIMKKHIKAGFRHFEINGDLYHVLPGIITPEMIEELVKIKQKLDLTFSIHLPLWAIEPAAFAKHIRKASVETFIESIDLTKPLDPICWVIHPTGTLTVEFIHMRLPDFVQNLMLNQFTSYATNVIEKVLDKTEIESRKIAVENIEYPFTEMYPVIEKLDLSICFDTGHLLAGYSGEYDLPVRELLLNLLERNFKGPLVYELNFDEILQSMEFIKEKVPEALE